MRCTPSSHGTEPVRGRDELRGLTDSYSAGRSMLERPKVYDHDSGNIELPIRMTRMGMEVEPCRITRSAVSTLVTFWAAVVLGTLSWRASVIPSRVSLESLDFWIDVTGSEHQLELGLKEN